MEQKYRIGCKLVTYRASVHICTLDLETTGLDTDTCDILEIACLSMADGDVRFATLVKPAKLDYDTAFTGITPQVLEESKAPTTAEALVAFGEWITKSFPDETKSVYLMAHNCFKFDQPVLQRALATANVKLPSRVIYVDSLIAFRETFPDRKGGFGLAKLLGDATIPLHRAMTDCMALDYVVRTIDPADRGKFFRFLLSRTRK